jgi:uncharacterized protein YaaW (UPF0174 family)
VNAGVQQQYVMLFSMLSSASAALARPLANQLQLSQLQHSVLPPSTTVWHLKLAPICMESKVTACISFV